VRISLQLGGSIGERVATPPPPRESGGLSWRHLALEKPFPKQSSPGTWKLWTLALETKDLQTENACAFQVRRHSLLRSPL